MVETVPFIDPETGPDPRDHKAFHEALPEKFPEPYPTHEYEEGDGEDYPGDVENERAEVSPAWTNNPHHDQGSQSG